VRFTGLGALYSSPMKTVACPNCSGDTIKAADKPYCTSCGWNVSAAEEAVRIQSIAYLIGVLLFAGLLGYGALIRHGNGPMVVAAVAALAGVIPLYYFARIVPLRRLSGLRNRLSIAPPKRERWFKFETHREFRRTESPPTGAAPEQRKHFELHVHVDRPRISIAPITGTATESASAQMNVAQDHLRRVIALPLPRVVRMTRRGILYIFPIGPALVALDCISGYWAAKGLASAQSLSAISQQDWVSVLTTVILAATVVSFWRKIFRDRRLLAYGEITLGRILRQNSGRHESSTITYSFSDKQALTFTQTSTDYSKQYYEGMWALIFYDSENPRRNVADGCALCRLDIAPV